MPAVLPLPVRPMTWFSITSSHARMQRSQRMQALWSTVNVGEEPSSPRRPARAGGSGGGSDKHIETEALGIAAATHRQLAKLVEWREFPRDFRLRRRLPMIGREQLRDDLDRLPHAIAVRPVSIHGEDFHAVLHRMLAGRQELALRGAFAALLPVDLHDAEPANRDRRHVRQMAKRRDRDLRFVARLLT